MNTAEFTIRNGLLGDSIWPLAAIRELGRQRGSPVTIHVENPGVRDLYRWDPAFIIVDSPGGHVLDESRAWHYAIDNRPRDMVMYFGEAFFEQVGADLLPESNPYFSLRGREITPNDSVVLCPFSSSCTGRKGFPPNKTMKAEWWEELADRIREMAGYHVPVVSLGGPEDMTIQGTSSLRGQPLRNAAAMILGCRALVTVETFACVVAGGKRSGKAVVLSSATPPRLHFTDDMKERGFVNIFASHPWEWPLDDVASRVADFLGDTAEPPP